MTHQYKELFVIDDENTFNDKSSFKDHMVSSTDVSLASISTFNNTWNNKVITK